MKILISFVILSLPFFGISGVEHSNFISFQLTGAQQQKLSLLIGSNKQAKDVFEKIKKTADSALSSEPNPVEVIRTEGLLKNDSKKIATQKSLKDMDKVYALAAAWVVTKDEKYRSKTKEFILAWAKVNKASGDPIDETNLEDMIRAYDFVKTGFTDDEQRIVDEWLLSVANAEVTIKRNNPKRATNFNNWNSHRLKVVGLIALVTGNKEYLDWVQSDYKEQIAKDLRPDGGSFDFEERDAMHYHLYTLEPLLVLCAAMKVRRYNLYDYQAPNGSSLKKSVAFIMPYVRGEKKHEEYVHSKVKFDRERASAGQKEFAVGREFEPKEALLTLSLYYFFDAEVLPLIQKLSNNDSLYPSWNVLIASVQNGR
jgi:hypothetical protein